MLAESPQFALVTIQFAPRFPTQFWFEFQCQKLRWAQYVVRKEPKNFVALWPTFIRVCFRSFQTQQRRPHAPVSLGPTVIKTKLALLTKQKLLLYCHQSLFVEPAVWRTRLKGLLSKNISMIRSRTANII